MAMRLFFVLVTVVGSAYLLFNERGDRKVAIVALVVSCFGLLLQLNVITLHLRYARTAVWAAIAVCAVLSWMRDGSKASSTVAASMAFVSALTVALSLRLLH
ncbi:MAG TPA: hypothetical protein VEQ15_11110 [Myxococcales bacterium]|jgi:hypothetical protein|nr:hypothetical protein [Myxococcales bacterium]